MPLTRVRRSCPRCLYDKASARLILFSVVSRPLAFSVVRLSTDSTTLAYYYTVSASVVLFFHSCMYVHISKYTRLLVRLEMPRPSRCLSMARNEKTLSMFIDGSNNKTRSMFIDGSKWQSPLDVYRWLETTRPSRCLSMVRNAKALSMFIDGSKRQDPLDGYRWLETTRPSRWLSMARTDKARSMFIDGSKCQGPLDVYR